MTLLVNEIHLYGNLARSLVIQAADRRLTVGGAFHSNKPKIFRIPYLNASVGFFGLAQLDRGRFLSDWLPAFIQSHARISTIPDFATALASELNQTVDKGLLSQYASGFHLAGYDSRNYPTFWFITNVGDLKEGVYVDFQRSYSIREDFLRRDAPTFGYNGTTPDLRGNFVMYYANGDLRAFKSIWQRLDEATQEMSQSNFNHPQSISDVEKLVRWKMKTVSSFYRNFAKAKIIGGPVDAIVLVPSAA